MGKSGNKIMMLFLALSTVFSLFVFEPKKVVAADNVRTIVVDEIKTPADIEFEVQQKIGELYESGGGVLKITGTKTNADGYFHMYIPNNVKVEWQATYKSLPEAMYEGSLIFLEPLTDPITYEKTWRV